MGDSKKVFTKFRTYLHTLFILSKGYYLIGLTRAAHQIFVSPMRILIHSNEGVASVPPHLFCFLSEKEILRVDFEYVYFCASPLLSGEYLEMKHWVLSHTEEWKIQAVKAHSFWLSSRFSGFPAIFSTNGASFFPLFLCGHGCYLLFSLSLPSICSNCHSFHSDIFTVEITPSTIGFPIAVILTVW